MPSRPSAYPGAERFLPDRLSLPALREAARRCRGCPLYRDATQTVFGSGRRSAHLMLVGEQPGDEEDKAGLPFVGPAGLVLDEALEAAGIDRLDVYVTNVVKHFKHLIKGWRRWHKKPSKRDIDACRAWIEKEIEVVRPEVLVCLGATAAEWKGRSRSGWSHCRRPAARCGRSAWTRHRRGRRTLRLPESRRSIRSGAVPAECGAPARRRLDLSLEGAPRRERRRPPP